MCKYAIEIFYSEENEGHIAVVPSYPAALHLVVQKKRHWKKLSEMPFKKKKVG